MPKGSEFEQPDHSHFSLPKGVKTIRDLMRHLGPPEPDESVTGRNTMPAITPEDESEEPSEQAKQEMRLCLEDFVRRRANRRRKRWNPED